jgi:hypothetical protein
VNIHHPESVRGEVVTIPFDAVVLWRREVAADSKAFPLIDEYMKGTERITSLAGIERSSLLNSGVQRRKFVFYFHSVAKGTHALNNWRLLRDGGTALSACLNR